MLSVTRGMCLAMVFKGLNLELIQKSVRYIGHILGYNSLVRTFAIVV